MPSNNLDRWSGPALAVGGILWLVPWVTDLSQAVQFILTIPALLLIAVGLIGLYRRMSAGSGNGPGLALGAALLGLLLLIASAVGGLAMGVESNTNVPLVLRALFGTGMVLLALGLAGLSVVGFSRNALGSWSFTAPLAALAMLAYVVSIVLAPFVFLLAKRLVLKYRAAVLTRFQQTKPWKLWKATPFYKWYMTYEQIYG